MDDNKRKSLFRFVRDLAETINVNVDGSTMLVQIRERKDIFEYASKKYKNKEFIIFLLLLPHYEESDETLNNIIEDIDENLTYLELVKIEKRGVETECPSCSDGEASCEDCDGEGTDDEVEPCDTCQGGGMVSCDDCGGDGFYELDEDEVKYYDILTYNVDILNQITEKSDGTYDYPKDVIDSSIIDEIESDNKSIIIYDEFEITSNYYNYNDGDLIFRNWHGNPQITVQDNPHKPIKVKI